jgi:hypothetical protein
MLSGIATQLERQKGFVRDVESHDHSEIILPPVCHDTLLFGGFSRKGTVRNGLLPPGRTLEDTSGKQRKAASRLGFS